MNIVARSMLIQSFEQGDSAWLEHISFACWAWSGHPAKYSDKYSHWEGRYFSRLSSDTSENQVVIKREAAPFGNCSKEWTDTGVKEDLTMKNGKKIPYTQGVGKFKTKINMIFISIHQLCTRNCFFATFAMEGGCAHPRVYDLPNQMITHNVSRPCNLDQSGPFSIWSSIWFHK